MNHAGGWSPGPTIDKSSHAAERDLLPVSLSPASLYGDLRWARRFSLETITKAQPSMQITHGARNSEDGGRAPKWIRQSVVNSKTSLDLFHFTAGWRWRDRYRTSIDVQRTTLLRQFVRRDWGKWTVYRSYLRRVLWKTLRAKCNRNALSSLVKTVLLEMCLLHDESSFWSSQTKEVGVRNWKLSLPPRFDLRGTWKDFRLA